MVPERLEMVEAGKFMVYRPVTIGPKAAFVN